MGQLASVEYDQIVWPVGIKSGCKGFFKVHFAGAVRLCFHVPCVRRAGSIGEVEKYDCPRPPGWK